MKFLLPAIIAVALGVVAVSIIGMNIVPVLTAIETGTADLGKLVASVLPEPRR